MAIDVISGVLDPMLKETWPEMQEMFYQKDQAMPLREFIDRTGKIPFRGTKEGKYYKFPLITSNGQNAAVGIGETASLPYESEPIPDYVTGNVASHWQGIDISGFAMDEVNGGEASVVPALELLLRDTLTSFKHRENWLLHGDGGQMLATPSTFASNVVTVDDASMLENGSRISIIDQDDSSTYYPSSSTHISSIPIKVTNLNKTAKTFTAVNNDGSALTLSDNTGQTAYGIYPYNGQGKAMYGLGIICTSGNPTTNGSTTNYFMGKNASAAGNEFWNAKRVNAASAILDIQSHVQVLLDNIRADALEFCNPNDEGITWLVPTRWQNYRAISNALKMDMRTMSDQKTLRDTFKAVEYEGAFFVPDNHAPASKLRFANLKYLRMFETVPLQWNTKSVEWLQGTSASDNRVNDTYARWLYTRKNVFTVIRKAHGEIYGLNATA